MKELPLLSVIVPVYNVEAYLPRCIRSIAEQTYANLEVLLVDDGSTDAGGGICDAWAARDSRVRVIHKENGGAGAARNLGMDMARGELLGFVDSDDYLHPKMYEHLYSLMAGDVDIAECVLVTTDRDDAPLEDGSAAKTATYTREAAMRLHIRDEIFCQTPPNKLYRRKTVENVRFPVGNLIDDEFFTYRAIGSARRLARSDSRMYAYRQQTGSAMHKPYSLKRLQGLDGKLERLDYLKQHLPGLEQEAKRDLLFSCLMAMQSCLRFLPGDELEAAWEKINGILPRITPVPWSREAGLRRNGLLKLAQISFPGTCRMLNFLEDIHVLR